MRDILTLLLGVLARGGCDWPLLGREDYVTYARHTPSNCSIGPLLIPEGLLPLPTLEQKRQKRRQSRDFCNMADYFAKPANSPVNPLSDVVFNQDTVFHRVAHICYEQLWLHFVKSTCLKLGFSDIDRNKRTEITYRRKLVTFTIILCICYFNK
jgi:hypothetical protein